MANNQKFKVKNGLYSQNIQFIDSVESPTETINISMLPTGTLSFSGSAGQLFSITDSLTGTIFAVNDISGVPSIEVDDDGTIRFAELFGNVLIGTASDDGTNKVQIVGDVKATSFVVDGGASTGFLKADGSVDSTEYVSTASSYDSWTLRGDNTDADQTIENGNTVQIAGGTYITTTSADTDKVTITHDATNRTNTASTATPAHGGTFSAIASITTNATGHVETVDTVTVTLPGDSDTTYSIALTDGAAGEVDIDLTAGGSGSGTDTVTLKQGTNVTLSRSGDVVTINSSFTDTKQTIAADATNTDRYVTFVASAAATQTGLSDAGLVYNPGTNTLTTPNVWTSSIVGATSSITISAKTVPDGANVNGYSTTIRGGNGNTDVATNNKGGTVFVRGGSGGSLGGDGGTAIIEGGDPGQGGFGSSATFDGGIRDGAGGAISIAGGIASGTNKKGGDIVISAGAGTGNIGTTTIKFQTSTAVASGSGAQTLSDRMVINQTGQVLPGSNNTGSIGASGTVWANMYATTFNGALSGNATSATSAGTWTTARTLTIGSTGKSVDGSANVSWSLAEIGAQASGDYAVLNNSTANGDDYLFLNRNSADNAVLYVNQRAASGDIARFINNSTSGNSGTAGGAAGQFTVLNSGGFHAGADSTVVGLLTATQKSFTIDHPTKEGMKLRYGSLEGPENGVYVRGKLDGTNVIELPEYWTKLVDPDSITVQLTSIGSAQSLYVEYIVDNTIIVGGSENVKCFYMVNGERVDVEKLEVEFEG